MIPLVALMFPFMVLAGIIAIIFLLIRSVGRRGSIVPRPPVNVAAQVGADGFWLSSLEPGSVIYYQYWADGIKRKGQIVFQPGNDGRQFVYTGMQPNNLEIVRVVDPSGGFVAGPPYFADDMPSIVPPIIGAAAVQAVSDALANTQPESPAPSPQQFPPAY